LVEEKHEIEHLWQTFDPKDLFEELYNPGENNDEPEPNLTKVTFAEPMATYESTNGARSETSLRECHQQCLPSHPRY
jgi:hypothetical protein